MNNNLLADYVALSQFNYIYPFGSLPSNFFFRRVKHSPYWLSNDIRNAKISLSKKVTVYDAMTTVEHEGLPTINTVTSENSGKSMIGPYMDVCSNKESIQFSYKFESSIHIEDNEKPDGFLIISFDLLTLPLPAAFIKNKLKYVKPGTVITTVCPTCDEDWEPALDGFINLCGLDENNTKQCTTFNVKESKKCDLGSPISHEIIGNKLVFKIIKPHRVSDVQILFTAAIVEEKATNLLSLEDTETI